MTLNVVVCGSRTWADADQIRRRLRWEDEDSNYAVHFWHGACPEGADAFVAAYCRGSAGLSERGREHPMPADWKAHGKAAGPIRNRKLLEAAKPVAFVLAFLDVPASRGTLDMIHAAIKAGVPEVVIIRPTAPSSPPPTA